MCRHRQAASADGHTGGGDVGRLVAVGQSAGKRGAGSLQQGLEDKDEAGGLWRNAFDNLEIETEEEHYAKGSRIIQPSREVAVDEGPVRHDFLERQQGRGESRFIVQKNRHASQTKAGQPSGRLQLLDLKNAYNEPAEGKHIKQAADPVEPLTPGLGPFSFKPNQGKNQGRQFDGNGRIEDPAPAEITDHQASQSRAGGDAEIDGAYDDAQGPTALFLGIYRGKDGKAARCDHRSAYSLKEPEEDERLDGWGK